MPPVHPGEILREEFLEHMNITPYRLAQDIGVAPIRISEIIRGMRSITADTSLRLAQYFGVSAQFWLNLQTRYDLERQRKRFGERIQQEVQEYEKTSFHATV